MKRSILHKKKSENKSIRDNLNFEEYNNLVANKFHISKKVNFKSEGNESLNIPINEIEKNYRRSSYQFVYSTNNKNNYTKFGFLPNAQNENQKKINYLLDDQIIQLNNKNIYEKILGINIIKKNKKLKKLNTEKITNKVDYDSDDNEGPTKKRPRNYSFYESKSTKNLDVHNYIETDEANNDFNIDNNYNNTSFYCSNQFRNSLEIENKYSSKTLKAEPHLDGEIFNNHSIVFITDKSDPFKKSYSHNIQNDLKFCSENQTPRDYNRLSLQNNSIENRINSQIYELSENNSDYQLKQKCLEKNVNDNINKKDLIQKEEMIKNNRIIKQKKINHKKEIMRAKNKKKKNSKENLINQLLSKEFLISLNSRSYNKNKDKNILINIDKDGLIDFQIQKKKDEILCVKQNGELKKNLFNSNRNINDNQNGANLKFNINKNNISKNREVNNVNKKSTANNVIDFEIGEKDIFYNKINKPNRINMNKNENGKFRKYNSYNRYNNIFNINSNKRSNNKSNNKPTLSISQKMSKYTGIKNKTIEEINNNSFKNINLFKNNIINDNRERIVEYKSKNSKNSSKNYNINNSSNNNIGYHRMKKPSLTINKYNNLDEYEKKDLNQNNYLYNGSDEELKIILNDNLYANNDTNKAVRNKQIINFIYKKKEIKEKQNKSKQNELKNDLNENKLNNINICENKKLSNMKDLNSNNLIRSEIKNKYNKDISKNIEINKYERQDKNKDKGNKKNIFNLIDNVNGGIIVDYQKNNKIGKLENYINRINNDVEEYVILNDDKIVYCNPAPPKYIKNFGENKISKEKNINIHHQKEKIKKEKKLSKDIKDNIKNKNNNYKNESINNGRRLINNINVDSINNGQKILGNCEIINNNNINNSNNDNISIKELKSEYEFNIDEDKFYKPLNTYENLNFKKINPFESQKCK